MVLDWYFGYVLFLCKIHLSLRTAPVYGHTYEKTGSLVLLGPQEQSAVSSWHTEV
jgi:hypothetical protein